MVPERLSADAQGIARAAQLVRAGEVIGFPTDTVYGLMALPDAAEKIYSAKRRPQEKQLIAMAASAADLRRLVEITPEAARHAHDHWPGPLTIVLPAHGGGTLGVRVPDHPLALALLLAVGQPVLTTSANLSGRPPALAAAEVDLDGVAAVLDGGRAPGGIPSTVIDLTGPEPRLLRAGPVTL